MWGIDAAVARILTAAGLPVPGAAATPDAVRDEPAPAPAPAPIPVPVPMPVLAPVHAPIPTSPAAGPQAVPRGPARRARVADPAPSHPRLVVRYIGNWNIQGGFTDEAQDSLDFSMEEFGQVAVMLTETKLPPAQAGDGGLLLGKRTGAGVYLRGEPPPTWPSWCRQNSSPE